MPMYIYIYMYTAVGVCVCVRVVAQDKMLVCCGFAHSYMYLDFGFETLDLKFCELKL